MLTVELPPVGQEVMLVTPELAKALLPIDKLGVFAKFSTNPLLQALKALAPIEMVPVTVLNITVLRLEHDLKALLLIVSVPEIVPKSIFVRLEQSSKALGPTVKLVFTSLKSIS